MTIGSKIKLPLSDEEIFFYRGRVRPKNPHFYAAPIPMMPKISLLF
jgi:hypothetical protein